jgi:hypothetical protein
MEEEGQHRREIEKEDAKHLRGAHLMQIRQQGRGQLFGLLVAFGGFALAGFAIYCGHPRTAAVIAGVDLVGLVTVFVTGTRLPPPVNEPDSESDADKEKR